MLYLLYGSKCTIRRSRTWITLLSFTFSYNSVWLGSDNYIPWKCNSWLASGIWNASKISLVSSSTVTKGWPFIIAPRLSVFFMKKRIGSNYIVVCPFGNIMPSLRSEPPSVTYPANPRLLYLESKSRICSLFGRLLEMIDLTVSEDLIKSSFWRATISCPSWL